MEALRRKVRRREIARAPPGDREGPQHDAIESPVENRVRAGGDNRDDSECDGRDFRQPG